MRNCSERETNKSAPSTPTGDQQRHPPKEFQSGSSWIQVPIRPAPLLGQRYLTYGHDYGYQALGDTHLPNKLRVGVRVTDTRHRGTLTPSMPS